MCNVVRQELIVRQLDRSLATAPGRVLDLGARHDTARHSTQSLRLAHAGYAVAALESDAEMRSAFAAALNDETPTCARGS